MKTSKILTFSLFAFTFSLAVQAAPSWSTIYSEAYDGDESLTTKARADYTAYYCTVEAANTMFKASTLGGIESYLKQNFATGKSAMGTTAGSYELTQGGYIEGTAQYQFISYFSEQIAAGNYFAVAFYQDSAFRVFSSDDVDSGNLTFDDLSTSATQSSGSWQTVPEPTSGMLFLLGLAALALKRKRGSRLQVEG